MGLYNDFLGVVLGLYHDAKKFCYVICSLNSLKGVVQGRLYGSMKG